MNYKIATIVLVIALIASIIFLVNSLQKQKNSIEQLEEKTISETTAKKLEDYESLMNVLNSNDTLNDLWQRNGRVHPRRTGKPVSLNDAKKKIKSFRDWNGDFYTHIRPFAFAFGIDNIEDMVKSIRQNNMNTTNPNDSIKGVRIYLVHSDTLLPGNTKPSKYLDLLFVPVNKDGKDIYNLNAPITIDDISTALNKQLLNTSSPCPNMCN